MKSIIIISLLFMSSLFGGCATNEAMRPVHPGAMWMDSDIYSMDAILTPHWQLEQQYNHYVPPRKYVVTPKDEIKYDRLNTTIQQRLKNLKVQEQSIKETNSAMTTSMMAPTKTNNQQESLYPLHPALKPTQSN